MKLLHIQGLRAVAIASVALFHFFPNIFPNGYLGVDIFFVLSGYLMTMIMSRSNRIGASEIGEFLYRRFRRITPLYYLITLAILVSLKYCPPISWEVNQKSATKSLTFTTNLFKPMEGEGYFEKLGLAVDMFAHTWSLAVEVQFYLLFPLLFIMYSRLGQRLRNISVIISSVLSLFIHLYLDEFHSFNSVFCRIWQFLAGTITFNISKAITQNEILETEYLPNIVKLEKILSNGCIWFIMCILLWIKPIDPTYARINTVFITASIIHFGRGSIFLENKFAVFIGDISYCWYLIHWPIIAHLKLKKMGNYTDLSKGLIYSIVLSAIVHFAYEKQYLKFPRKVVYGIVGALMVLNIFTLQTTKVDLSFSLFSNTGHFKSTVTADPYIYLSDNYVYGPMGYENKTKDEKIVYQIKIDATDNYEIQIYKMLAKKDKNNELLYYFKGSKKANLTFMVIGNSLAENTINLFRKECKHKFRKIYIAAMKACEPLVHSILPELPKVDCARDYRIMDAVRLVKPDVLFMIYRYFDTMDIENGTNPFNDHHFSTAIKRLREYEQVVSKKIFIMEPFPPTSESLTTELNEHLRTGRSFSEKDFAEVSSQRFLVAKQRIQRLVSACEKCQSIDFATMFYINGKFTVYDPKHFISFVTAGKHFSFPGLQRIRPLIKETCDRFNSLKDQEISKSKLPGSFNYPSDIPNYPTMPYEDMTTKEKISYQDGNDSFDYELTIRYRKDTIQDRDIDILYHFKEKNNASNLTFMVIGNSIADNLVGLFQSECKNNCKSMHIASIAGCEPLIHTTSQFYGIDCSRDYLFIDAVKKVKPDVLFIVYRHIDTTVIKNGTNPFNDLNFKTATSLLREYDKLVSTRIYLVDPWFSISTNISKQLNDFMRKGKEFDERLFVDTSSQKLLIGKQRMTRLSKGCTKCRIFDLSTMFYIDGKFSVYDPKHYMSFFTSGQHFSLAGLERIRPLVKDLCNQTQ